MSQLCICPNCQKSLRTTAVYSSGQRIRCPACQTVFAVSVGATASAVQVQRPAPVAAAPRVLPSAEPLPRRPAPRQSADAFDDDFDDVRPRRRYQDVDDIAQPLWRRKSGGHLGLILALSGGLALLGVLLLTAFVWPGFLLSGTPSQARSMFAFVPPNSNFLAGAQLGRFRREAQFQGKWNEFQQQIAQLPNVPAEARDLLNDADELIIAGGSDFQSSGVFIASTERPYDAEKVKRTLNAGAAIQVQGQTLYPVQNLAPGKQAFLALPSDKFLVVAFMPPDAVAKLLAGAKQATLHPDLQEQVEHAHRAPIWIAARFDDDTKFKLAQLQAQGGVGLQMFGGQDLATLIGLLPRSKGALLTIDAVDQRVKLSVGVTYKDAGDSAQAKAALGGAWLQGQKALDLVALFGGGNPQVGKLLGEVRQSFAIDQQGNTVLASIQVNQDTLQGLANAAPQIGNGGLPGFNIPGFNLNPPGGNPNQGKVVTKKIRIR